MEVFLFMFDGLISNNKEIKYFALPLGTFRHNFFFFISLVNMEKLILKFIGPISYFKENRNPTPLERPRQKKYFFISMIDMKILMLCFMVLF